MNKKIKNPAGFSLMELLVVVFIILIISVIGNNVYQSQREQLNYNDSVTLALNLIKKARNYAIGSRLTYDGSIVDPEDQNFIPPEGYGVYIERDDELGASRFVLFANTQADDDIERNQYDDGFDIIEEEYFLSSGVEFTQILSDLAPTPLGEDNIVIIFRPPLAETTIAVNDPGLVSASSMILPLEVYLEMRRPTVASGVPSKYIRINRISGLVEIN